MMTEKDYNAIALELVKMSVENNEYPELGRVYMDGHKDILDMAFLYNYYYEKITEKNLKKREQVSIVKNNEKSSNNSEFLQRLREKVVENSGDMEPRVSTLLLNMIDTELKK